MASLLLLTLRGQTAPPSSYDKWPFYFYAPPASNYRRNMALARPMLVARIKSSNLVA